MAYKKMSGYSNPHFLHLKTHDYHHYIASGIPFLQYQKLIYAVMIAKKLLYQIIPENIAPNDRIANGIIITLGLSWAEV